MHFDRVTHKVVCSLFQFHSYSSASIAQLLIHTLSTHTRMLSTQNLALRNRRVDEVPPEAGDFARIINGSLFSLNGGRSSESTFDLNGGHLYWITSVLKQFDRTPSAPIKFSERAKLHRSMTDNNICISYSTHHVKDPHTRFTNFASVTVPVSRIVSINDLQTCYNLRFENDKRKIS